MRLFILALTLLLTAATTAPAQMMTPDGENGRYNSYPVADGVLRLDTRTGQMSQCTRSDVGWACTTIPDERAALEAEIARLQDENAKLKKELLARGLPVPGVSGPSAAKTEGRELKLPSDAEFDKIFSFFEKIWRRLIEMARTVQNDSEKKN
jgi:hypothetical protein